MEREWIKYHGEGQPVEDWVRVDTKDRDGTIMLSEFAKKWDWTHLNADEDIVEWRMGEFQEE